MKRGFTLVELLATLAILGLGAGVAALTLPTLRPAPAAEVLRSLRAARDAAVRTGEPVVWRRDSVRVRFFPDGSSTGARFPLDSLTVTVDALTGAVGAAR